MVAGVVAGLATQLVLPSLISFVQNRIRSKIRGRGRSSHPIVIGRGRRRRRRRGRIRGRGNMTDSLKVGSAMIALAMRGMSRRFRGLPMF